jgi:PKD repeat protein
LDESANCIAVYEPIPGFDQLPVARFSFMPSSPTAGSSVDFDASSSTDDRSIVSWEWDFENDGAIDASGEQVAHTFNTSGARTVRLVVTDDGGQQSESTSSVNVSQPTLGFSLTILFQGGGAGTVQADLAGLSCIGDCSQSFPAGSQIFPSPFSMTGSVFSHWGFDGSPVTGSDCDADFGAEGCGLDLTSDRTVRVYFE